MICGCGCGCGCVLKHSNYINHVSSDTAVPSLLIALLDIIKQFDGRLHLPPQIGSTLCCVTFVQSAKQVMALSTDVGTYPEPDKFIPLHSIPFIEDSF